jgi:hypothetical protein
MAIIRAGTVPGSYREESEEEEEEEEYEEEVFEITIRGKKYFTADAENGEIYTVLNDDEIGDEIGAFKKGIPKFY